MTPTLYDLANHPAAVWEQLNRGTPSWLLHRPPRLRDLANHHQEVLNLVDSFDSEVAIVSNAPDLFTHRTITSGDAPISDWLSTGTCAPLNDVSIIVFDWDIWAEGVDGYRVFREKSPLNCKLISSKNVRRFLRPYLTTALCTVCQSNPQPEC